MLVKIIAHDRTFEGVTRKAVRAIKETRIRGVKTNIPFLINVLQSDVWNAGKCTTTFIEKTPELFHIVLGKDRATKIAEFIGNKIVNESKGHKPEFDPIVPPSFGQDKNGKTIFVEGAKDKFLRMGAKDYTQSLLKEKRLLVTDTTMRDAHQSLMATRLRTNDLIVAAPATNMAMANAFSVEAWGGATFDVAYRFLTESPWRRLQQLSEAMPNTLIQMLLRASNAVLRKLS